MKPTAKQFQKFVYDYYHAHGRDLSWRQAESNGQFDPYKILVSELMLQQTQVSRVIPKFEAFIAQFPTLASLAKAPLAEVLIAWSGLGYNRRARYLHQAAQQIVELYNGQLPADTELLEALPGVGKNTAAAIAAYSFNQPVVFIETNIRSVYLHHFFPEAEAVSDKDLLPIIASTLDKANPRQWYWALMDYGSHLKKLHLNPSRRSKHHSKQSSFIGSRRFIRGQVIKLLAHSAQTYQSLQNEVADQRLDGILEDLIGERLISKQGRTYTLAK